MKKAKRGLPPHVLRARQGKRILRDVVFSEKVRMEKHTAELQIQANAIKTAGGKSQDWYKAMGQIRANKRLTNKLPPLK